VHARGAAVQLVPPGPYLRQICGSTLTPPPQSFQNSVLYPRGATQPGMPRARWAGREDLEVALATPTVLRKPALRNSRKRGGAGAASPLPTGSLGAARRALSPLPARELPPSGLPFPSSDRPRTPLPRATHGCATPPPRRGSGAAWRCAAHLASAEAPVRSLPDFPEPRVAPGWPHGQNPGANP